MKKNLIFLITSLLLSSLMTGEIEIKKVKTVKNETNKNLILIGKKVTVNGEVKNFIIAIGGEVEIRGRVGKDVIAFFSDLTVGNSSEINGDLITVGGNVEREEGSVIKGKTHYVHVSLKQIDSSINFLSFEKGTIILVKIIFSIISLLLALFVYAIIPEKITHSAEILSENFLKVSFIGVVSFLSAIVLFFSFIILSFIIIGIPLLIAEMILLILMIIFGRIVLYYYIGKSLIEISRLQIYSPAIYILLGTSIYLALYFLPFIGALILKLLVLLELGVGIGFLLSRRLSLETLSEKIDRYPN